MLKKRELSLGPNLPLGALKYTAPPGGDRPPSPGDGFGDGSSERHPASSRAGVRDQGEGSSAEGQMPGGTGIMSLWIRQKDNLFFVVALVVLYVYLCVSVFIYSSYNFFLSPSSAADSEGAAGSGDKKTTGIFQSDAETWCVGRDRLVKYVAPLASTLTVFLAASQQQYVTSNIDIWKHMHTQTLRRTCSHPRHMCTPDYINLQENSTTTNNEPFVCKWTGCAKLFEGFPLTC